MADRDPVTHGELRKSASIGCGIILGGAAIIALAMFALYITACAFMPTGCH